MGRGAARSTRSAGKGDRRGTLLHDPKVMQEFRHVMKGDYSCVTMTHSHAIKLGVIVEGLS